MRRFVLVNFLTPHSERTPLIIMRVKKRRWSKAIKLAILLLLTINTVLANEWEEYTRFESHPDAPTLRVLSSTDTSVFAPIIQGFLADTSAVNVEYLVASSSDIDAIFRQSPEQFDLVISSAMDLQLKLVNDGFAQSVDNPEHPRWAQWRQSVFGFTLEPAAIVINRDAFKNIPVPRTREDMIDVLRSGADEFKGRVGTYDIRQSGLGYLLATQDARSSETYWRLMEILGRLDARLYCCSGQMIEDLANGDIAISYNVLGSYANARLDLADKIEVILPDDFPTTMMRTVLISEKTREPAAAREFLRYLVSARWSTQGQRTSSLPTLETAGNISQRSLIALNPGLMIFLDKMKRRLFLTAWESALIQ